MAVRIITDSTSDIPYEAQETLGIDIVPLSVIFNGVKYSDGIELKKDQFYKMLGESDQLPTTSQVNPDGFHDLFRGYIDNGDDIVGIFISSKLSGTYQSACIVKEMLGSDKIYVVDSKSATFGAALLVYEAIALRDKGFSASDIYSRLESLSERISFVAAVDTLKYLKMGGRLSSAEAVLGGILHVKPLVSIIDGEIKSIGRERGQSAAFKFMQNMMKENAPDKDYPIVFGHSDSPDSMSRFVSYIEESTGIKPDYICEIGCVIGTHGGPGCIGFAYIPEKK